MFQQNKSMPASRLILLILVLINAIILKFSFINGFPIQWALVLSIPILFVALYDVTQKKHAITRNYPLIGRLRFLFEKIRPEMRQYFFESDLDGKPFNRRQRSIIYQRAKNEKQTVAFGMQADPSQPGYEWVAHSIYPIKLEDNDLRVWIGNHQCSQPYNASIYNIAAMSYGALSKTAIASLNKGALTGGFAHNTGEGGISDHHLQGGDLIWQIGTGYFGCRNSKGAFDARAYKKNAIRPEVKMIELKLSQGAKPGHGGILPAAKNTAEIAAIRNVTAGSTVHSPAAHKEFHNAQGMLRFLVRLRGLSGGKPVGFKLCIGDKQEFIDICAAIVSLGIIPDFISVDGGEGGTGAAPMEFTDHLGMPLHEALAFVKRSLTAHGLSGKIKVLAAGKIITGFDILKAISLGADACYSARGMMMALGCIQALICDSGKCPVGVATQNPDLYKGLDPTDKSIRVASFHKKTIEATKEIMEACAFKSIDNIHSSKFFKRINEQEVKSFEEIFFMDEGTMVKSKFQSYLN